MKATSLNGSITEQLRIAFSVGNLSTLGSIVAGIVASPILRVTLQTQFVKPYIHRIAVILTTGHALRRSTFAQRLHPYVHVPQTTSPDRFELFENCYTYIVLEMQHTGSAKPLIVRFRLTAFIPLGGCPARQTTHSIGRIGPRIAYIAVTSLAKVVTVAFRIHGTAPERVTRSGDDGNRTWVNAEAFLGRFGVVSCRTVRIDCRGTCSACCSPDCGY